MATLLGRWIVCQSRARRGRPHFPDWAELVSRLLAELVSRLLDDLIRPRQQRRREREAECLGGLQINDELELRRLLDWKVGGLGAFQNLVR
jgi:hypothetical protein